MPQKKKKTNPPKLDNPKAEALLAIKNGRYIEKDHAIDRKNERNITLNDALYVIKNGFNEKSKDKFDEAFQSWNYAFRGKNLDDDDLNPSCVRKFFYS